MRSFRDNSDKRNSWLRSEADAFSLKEKRKNVFRSGFWGRVTAVFAAALLLCALMPVSAKADGGLIEESSWEEMFQTEAAPGRGLIQSVCVTNDYIITIENTADSADMADIVTSYYKNDYDKDGNPVARYSIANQNGAEEWEHGNGMCYNPNTNEIYVALYTNTIPENRGCLYVMDPDTLAKKGSIKLFDDCNILAIDYDVEKDIYYIQTNADRGFSVLTLDSNFQILSDLGPEPADPGYNFQDFCIEGDFILQFPLTWGMGIGEYMMAYSFSQNAVINVIQLFFDGLHETFIEPESIARLDETTFIVPVNATTDDNIRRCVFYRVYFPNLPLENAGEAAQTQTTSSSGSSVSSGISQTSQASSQAVSASASSAASSSSASSSAASVSSAVSSSQSSAGVSSSVSQTSAASSSVSQTSSVSSTSILSVPMEVNVTKGSITLTPVPEKTEKQPHTGLIAVPIILAAAAFGLLLYVKYVREERARKAERLRNRRRVALAKASKDEDEKEFDDMLYRDFSNLYNLESWKNE